MLNSRDTIYDLASLTKILATTLIAAEAIALGKLELEERPFARWPGVRISDLLNHTSGLPAIRNLFGPRLDRGQVFANALQIDLEYPTSSRTVYSDIGFIALGSLLESRLKERLDLIFRDLANRYYEGADLFFVPTGRRDININAFAPTGYCPTRHRRLQGEVNDLNAFALSGVAPHAGLFGRLDDVARASRFLLNAIKKPSTPLEKIIQSFAMAPGQRGLGFDKADRRGSTGGVFSSRAVGHLGFTGTSLWIDPLALGGRGAFFILLTNRVEASSSISDMLMLRQGFHRAAARLLNSR